MKRKYPVILSIIAMICLCKLFEANAVEFAGREDEYTEMCQDMSQLSKSDVQVCRQYSEYLKNKNNNIQKNIASTQEKLNQTYADLTAASQQLETTTQQIESVKSELAVLEGSISQLNSDIAQKKANLKERMYVMQSYVNGNELIYLMFSAESFDQLLTRIQCIDELTNYDKDLITSLASDKTLLEEQSLALSTRYDELFALQSQQTTLMMALDEKTANYQNDLSANQSLLSNYQTEVGVIDESLTEAERRIQAEEDRKKAEEEEKRKEEENQNNQNKPSVPETPSVPSSGSIGTDLVSTALSKQGCAYVYGGTGPNSFDCSGFAQWVYRQNGIYIPRTVTSQYYACTLLQNPEPGDLVFFNTYTYLGHVGIYIGNGQFIHAGTSDTGVIISNFNSSYWQSIYQGAGRFR